MDQGAQAYSRYLAGDDDGLAEIIRAYSAGLTAFLCTVTGDWHAAEEVMEEKNILSIWNILLFQITFLFFWREFFFVPIGIEPKKFNKNYFILLENRYIGTTKFF